LDSVVHRVVEKSSEDILIGTNVSRISVEALSHLENTRCGSILGPEVSRYFRNSVDTNTVETIGADEILYPVFKVLTNVGVILVKVRESCKSAVLNTTLVIPVNITVRVIVGRLVQGVDL
jgi:hypothetical protein